MKQPRHSIFADIPDFIATEYCDTILETDDFRLERIISLKPSLEPDKFYCQDNDEWVVLIQGKAGLWIDGVDGDYILGPGDYCFIPAQRKHKVLWTCAEQKTIWLALFYKPKY